MPFLTAIMRLNGGDESKADFSIYFHYYRNNVYFIGDDGSISPYVLSPSHYRDSRYF